MLSLSFNVSFGKDYSNDGHAHFEQLFYIVLDYDPSSFGKF